MARIGPVFPRPFDVACAMTAGEPGIDDGTFVLMLSVESYVGRGWLTLKDGRIFGSDAKLSLQGTLKRDGASVVGRLTVQAGPDAPPRLRDRGRFYLEARGVADGDGFNLIGAGPLGMIVEVSCHRSVA